MRIENMKNIIKIFLSFPKNNFKLTFSIKNTIIMLVTKEYYRYDCINTNLSNVLLAIDMEGKHQNYDKLLEDSLFSLFYKGNCHSKAVKRDW